MDKNCRSDAAAFPELSDGMEQFIDELGSGIRRLGVRLAAVAIPGGMLILFALSKAA